jgi:hypothetical protein
MIGKIGHTSLLLSRRPEQRPRSGGPLPDKPSIGLQGTARLL